MSGSPVPPARDFRIRHFLLLWFAAAVLLACRDPDVWQHPHLYGEDGEIFYSQQAVAGNRVMIAPYNGYLHLVPRFAAAAVWLFPAGVAALLYATFGTMAGAFAISFFYLPGNRFMVGSDALRATACLIIAADFDVRVMTANLLNLQWFLLPVAVLICARCVYGPPLTSRWRVILYCFLTAVIGLTAPLLLVIFPVVALCAWRARREGRWILLSLCASMLVQAAVFHFSHGSGTPLPAYVSLWGTVRQSAGAACTSWCYRSVVTGLAGKNVALEMSKQHPLRLPIILVCVAFATPLALRKALGVLHVKLICWGLFLSLVITGAPLVIRNILVWYGKNGELQGYDETARYFLFASWAFTYIAAIFLDRILKEKRLVTSGLGSVAMRCAALASLFVIGIARNYSQPDGWKADWRDKAYLIDRWHALRDAHQPRQTVTIPIQPEPWVVYLPGSADGR